jgi:thiol-disulfide isomerase/thioredoxin
MEDRPLGPAPSEPEALPADSFWDGRLQRRGIWVVAFVADWCPFCRQFLPEFVRLEDPSFRTGRADVSSYGSPLWEMFDLDVVPTVIVFRDGAIVFRADGRLGEGLEESDLRAIRAAATAT